MKSEGVTIGRWHGLRLNCSYLLPALMEWALCSGGLTRGLKPQSVHPPLTTTSLRPQQLPQEPVLSCSMSFQTSSIQRSNANSWETHEGCVTMHTTLIKAAALCLAYNNGVECANAVLSTAYWVHEGPLPPAQIFGSIGADDQDIQPEVRFCLRASHLS